MVSDKCAFEANGDEYNIKQLRQGENFKRWWI